MNEQFFFYWLSWVLIVLVTFFMGKSRIKTMFLFILLLVVATINWKITVFRTFELPIAFLIIYIWSFIYAARFPMNLYRISACFTVMLGFIALLNVVKIAPIWFIIDYYFMIPLMMSFIIILLEDSFSVQIGIATFTLANGYLFYSLTLISYRLSDTIIEWQFFILFYLTILLLLISHAITAIFHYVRAK